MWSNKKFYDKRGKSHTETLQMLHQGQGTQLYEDQILNLFEFMCMLNKYVIFSTVLDLENLFQKIIKTFY